MHVAVAQVCLHIWSLCTCAGVTQLCSSSAEHMHCDCAWPVLPQGLVSGDIGPCCCSGFPHCAPQATMWSSAVVITLALRYSFTSSPRTLGTKAPLSSWAFQRLPSALPAAPVLAWGHLQDDHSGH